jgi:predicted dehydrogenase
MSIAALEAGKHVMCTVPMATSVDDCRKIVELSAKTGLKYMMAETVVYAREFLFIKQMADRGDMGRIQFVQASHQQDMDGWPNYWPGLPPMHYATHCVGPCLALQRLDAEEVSCFGSGRIRAELVKHYGSPFAIESAHVKLRNSDVVARVIRSLFDTARQYRESFDVYGSTQSFEWQLCEGEQPLLHTAKKPEPEIPSRVPVPDFAHLLPEPIRRFTTGAGCSVLCTRPYHLSKVALILGPYVHFTAAELGRFAIKRRPSGWRSGPSGSDRPSDDGGTPR